VSNESMAVIAGAAAANSPGFLVVALPPIFVLVIAALWFGKAKRLLQGWATRLTAGFYRMQPIRA
jgi:hypothetical protein